MPPTLTVRTPAWVGIAVVLSVALAVFALGLYALPGPSDPLAPGAPAAAMPADAPSGSAPSKKDLLARHLARNPRDGRGWVLLARIEFAGDRFAAAGEAYRKALEASPKVERDPGVWCEYADALAMAQGGVLAGRPREILERALALDPRHAQALEMAGGAAFEAGDYVGAVRLWRQLLERMPEGTPARRELARAADEAEAERRSVASAPIAALGDQPRMR